MAEVLREGIAPIQPDLTTLDNVRSFTPEYDAETDTLFLSPDNPRVATSVDCAGELWIRVDPESGEIVGVEIEDFEGVFIKNHPDVAAAWRKVRPRSLIRKTKVAKADSFPATLVAFLRGFLPRCSPQQRLIVMPA